MSSEPAIAARNLGKCYQLYARPQDRLKQFFAGGRRQYFREFWALRDVGFDIMPGEVVGILGRNGAGKSTLLQLVCGTLTPTVGEIAVKGRVAALLELGAGFNPEFSGRENVFLSAAVMGIPEAEIAARFEELVDFSGIRDFIDQPVKTYSSGMYVRLAFSVATSVEPDILVIDEALSVGDGEFARRSFDRIMALKQAGKTILFCSHSMYQIEALCDRAIWLEAGCVRHYGPVADSIGAYNAFLDERELQYGQAHAAPEVPIVTSAAGPVRVTKAEVKVDGVAGRHLEAVSGVSTLTVTVAARFDPAMPPPAVAMGFVNEGGRFVASCSTHNDGLLPSITQPGELAVEVTLPKLPLLKGSYRVDVYLLSEDGVLVYEGIQQAAMLDIRQRGLEQGIVSLPHAWHGVVAKPALSAAN